MRVKRHHLFGDGRRRRARMNPLAQPPLGRRDTNGDEAFSRVEKVWNRTREGLKKADPNTAKEQLRPS